MLLQNNKAYIEEALTIYEVALRVRGIEEKIKSEAKTLSDDEKIELMGLRAFGKAFFIHLGHWR
jgi:hypothetical protein